MQSWIESLIAHPLVFGQDADADAIENMVGIGRGELDSPVAEEEVVRFLDAAIEVRRGQVGQGVRPVTFYAWHDEQAMQLRFSVVRCTPVTLPFGARVEIVPDVRSIVRAFLAGDECIAWNELDGSHRVPPGPRMPHTVRVWAVQWTR